MSLCINITNLSVICLEFHTFHPLLAGSQSWHLCLWQWGWPDLLRSPRTYHWHSDHHRSTDWGWERAPLVQLLGHTCDKRIHTKVIRLDFNKGQLTFCPSDCRWWGDEGVQRGCRRWSNRGCLTMSRCWPSHFQDSSPPRRKRSWFVYPLHWNWSTKTLVFYFLVTILGGNKTSLQPQKRSNRY